MPQGIKIPATGQFACFSGPEMKVERFSCDIITPTAAGSAVDPAAVHDREEP